MDGNLLIISNNFPDSESIRSGGIFVKEQINYLKKYFDNIYVISPVPFGLEQLRKTSYIDYSYDNVSVFFPKYFNIPFNYKFGKFIWIALEKKVIISLIKKRNITFNFIHAHMTWPSGSVAAELKKQFNVPLVITEHTSSTFQQAAENIDIYWKCAFDISDSIIRVRKGDADLFERFNTSKEKIYIIPNGVDAKKFFPMNSEECKNILGLPNKKIILYVGNFYDEIKGHKYLINAVFQIVTTRKDIFCVFIGEGKLRSIIENQIHSLGLEDFILLVGKKSHNEIPVWMNACDIFVLPSLSESFGTVQIEAMACGKPVVATRNGGSDEIIISEDYGLLVKPADHEDLADKILQAIDREWDSQVIQHYAKKFSWENIAKEILSVYQNARQV